MPTNMERAFEEPPEVFDAWKQLNGAVKAGMDLPRYVEQFDEPVAAIVDDRRAAGLDAVALAVMDLAERVVDDATSITENDLQRLRDVLVFGRPIVEA